MFFDCLGDTALEAKPVLIAATGGTGRHSLVLDHALRPMFACLHAVVMPTAVFAAPEDRGADHGQGSLVGRITRDARELAHEMKRRETPVLPRPYADPEPFEHLLNGR